MPKCSRQRIKGLFQKKLRMAGCPAQDSALKQAPSGDQGHTSTLRTALEGETMPTVLTAFPEMPGPFL